MRHQPLHDLVAASYLVATGKIINYKQQLNLKKKGWELVDLKQHRIELDEIVKNIHAAAQLKFPCTATVIDLFEKQIDVDLVNMILNNRMHQMPAAFMEKKGPKIVRNYCIKYSEVMQYCARRICIHAHGKKYGNSAISAIQAVKKELEVELDIKMVGIKCLIAVHSMFFIDCGTEEETKLVQNFESCIKTLVQVLCGNEKLVWFTRSHNLVRQVLSKPSQLIFWNYQAVVQFSCGGVWLSYCRMHNAH